MEALEILSIPGEQVCIYTCTQRTSEIRDSFSFTLESLGQLYAFTYQPPATPTESGWGASSCEDLLSRWKCSQGRFRVSTVNRRFALCSSYPEEVIVPSSISDEDIIKASCWCCCCCCHHMHCCLLLLLLLSLLPVAAGSSIPTQSQVSNRLFPPSIEPGSVGEVWSAPLWPHQQEAQGRREHAQCVPPEP